MGLELAFQLRQARRVTRRAFRSDNKDVGQCLVAVNIQTQVNADGEHALAHQQHFGRALQRRRQPFAVEIGAGRIGAQIAQHGAVRVHVGHNIKHTTLQQGSAD